MPTASLSWASGPSEETEAEAAEEEEEREEADSSPITTDMDVVRVGGARGAAAVEEEEEERVASGVGVFSMEARVTPAVSLKHLEHMYPVCAEP